MKTASLSPALAGNRAEFENLIKDIRPELHRYVARMVGSAIDGEDVVQDALVKAYRSLPPENADFNLRGWLFRIAHNKAIDFLRRSNLQTMEQLDERLTADEPDFPLEQQESAKIALALFLKLAPRQRSSVILKDVMDYSLAEISEMLDATVPEIKAVLHRGRTHLRELAANVETSSPSLDERGRELLSRYADRFNAGDFEGVREMLADEVRLDLVNRTKLHGSREVGSIYFGNYQQTDDWYLKIGTIENRPALIVFDPRENLPRPVYFMLLEWDGDGRVAQIRDYRYARYVTRESEITVV